MKVGWDGGLLEQGSSQQTMLQLFFRTSQSLQSCRHPAPAKGRTCRAPGARSEQHLQGPQTTHQGPSPQPRLRPGLASERARRLRPGQPGAGASSHRDRGPGRRRSGDRRESARWKQGQARQPQRCESGVGKEARAGPPRGASRSCAALAGEAVGGQGGAGGVFPRQGVSSRAGEVALRSARSTGPAVRRVPGPRPWAGSDAEARGGLLSGSGLRPPGPRCHPLGEPGGVFLPQGNQTRN